MTERDEDAIAVAAEAMISRRHLPPTSSADDRIAERHVNGRRHRADPGPPSPGLPADLVLQGRRPHVMWSPTQQSIWRSMPREVIGGYSLFGGHAILLAVVFLDAASGLWGLHVAATNIDWPRRRALRRKPRYSSKERAQLVAERYLYLHHLRTPPR